MNLLAFFSHELTIERTCSMIIKVCTLYAPWYHWYHVPVVPRYGT